MSIITSSIYPCVGVLRGIFSKVHPKVGNRHFRKKIVGLNWIAEFVVQNPI